MSKLSFIGFCVENYADAIHRPSNEVYRLFRQEGLLDLLRSDYEDLSGMSAQYMIHFCDEYLNGTDSDSSLLE